MIRSFPAIQWAFVALAFIGFISSAPAGRSAQSTPSIPRFTRAGVLPPNIHKTGIAEFTQRFSGSSRRVRMIRSLRHTLPRLRAAGVPRVYITGSFVTRKENPGDLDMAIQKGPHMRWPPLILAARSAYGAGLRIYGADERVKDVLEKKIGKEQRLKWAVRPPTMLEFFQHSRTGRRLGIVALDLR